MKKRQLFGKILASALMCTMVIGVGCNQYDDDIDALNARIDNLATGQVATIASQVNGLDSVVKNLQTANQQLDGSLTNLIENIRNNYVTNNLLQTTLSSYALTSQVADAIVTAKNYADGVAQQALEDAKEAASGIAGEVFRESFDAAIDAAVLNADGSIQEARLSYDNKIRGFIAEAINEYDGNVDSKLAKKINDEVKNLQDQIDALKADVDALAAQIQSISALPEYTDGTTDAYKYDFTWTDYSIKTTYKYSYLAPKSGHHAEEFVMESEDQDAHRPQTQYEKMSGSVDSYNTLMRIKDRLPQGSKDWKVEVKREVIANEKNKTISLNNVYSDLVFVVAPASAANNMAALYKKGALSLYTEEAVTRGEIEDIDPAGTILDVIPFADNSGKVIVRARLDNYNSWTDPTYEQYIDPKTKAVNVALKVETANNEKSAIKTNIVSDFMGINLSSIVLEANAVMTRAGEVLEYESFDVPWTLTVAESKRTFLADAELKVYMNGSVVSLDRFNEITGENFAVKAYKAYSILPEDKCIDVDVNDLVWNSKLPFAQFAADKYGDSVVTGDDSFKCFAGVASELVIANGDENFGNYYFASYYRIVDPVEAEMTFPTQEFDWMYATFDQDVKFENLSVAGRPEGVDLQDVINKGELKFDESTLSDGTSFDSEEIFDITAENPGQIKIIASKNHAWDEVYNIRRVYSYADKTYILSGEVIFGDEPDCSDIMASFIDELVLASEMYHDFTAAEIWEQLPESFKNLFANYDEFLQNITAGETKESIRSGKAIKKATWAFVKSDESLRYEDTWKNTILDDQVEAVGDVFTDSIVLKFKKSDLYISVIAHATIVLDKEYTLDPNPTFIADNVAIADGYLNKRGQWAIDSIPTKDWYEYEPVIENVTRLYLTKKSEDTDGKVFPIFNKAYTGEFRFVEQPTWVFNKTNQLEVEALAQIRYWNGKNDKIVLAEETITIKTQDPIQQFEQTGEATIQYETDKRSTLNVAPFLSIVDARGNNWVNNRGQLRYGDFWFSDAFAAEITFGEITTDARVDWILNIDKNFNFSYSFNNTEINNDINVTIPVKVKYWLGEKSFDIKIKIAK